MRQFDVFVWGDRMAPPFTDKALGWFSTDRFNEQLLDSDAEWIVFAHSSIQIDRKFLNDLAETISSFPMVDAFAPRIHDTTTGKFLSGFRFDKRTGIAMLEENAPLRYVAAPHPYLAAFSRRIVQRTGRFDDELSTEEQLADYSFRMLHAGGSMFSVPYLVTSGTAAGTPYGNINDLAYAIVKSFGLWKSRRFLLQHAGCIHHLWANRRALQEKREKATLLSKLRKESLDKLF